VGELTSLNLGDLHLGPAAHVTCLGKGRKNRITPLDAQTVAVLRAFTTLPTGTEILFPTRTGTRMSRDALAKRLTQHAATASMTCSTLASKTVTPHVLRHTAAMRLLAAGIDTTVIALWLGHESIETTQIYLKSRELHQTSEKPQVTRSTWPWSVVLDRTYLILVVMVGC
jgi:integrase/recombinase XerD